MESALGFSTHTPNDKGSLGCILLTQGLWRYKDRGSQGSDPCPPEIQISLSVVFLPVLGLTCNPQNGQSLRCVVVPEKPGFRTLSRKSADLQFAHRLPLAVGIKSAVYIISCGFVCVCAYVHACVLQHTHPHIQRDRDREKGNLCSGYMWYSYVHDTTVCETRVQQNVNDAPISSSF